MAAASRWSAKGSTQFDLAPAGFSGSYRLAVGSLVMLSTFAVPFGILGGFGAIAFDDFGIALRIGMGIAGAGLLGLFVWLTRRLLVNTTALRSRVRVRADGAFIEVGEVQPRQQVWLSPLQAIKVTRPKPDGLGRSMLVLSSGDTSVRIAVGYRPADIAGLGRAIAKALDDAPKLIGDRGQPEPMPLGPPWHERLRQLGQAVLAPLRRPTPFFLLDVTAIVGSFVAYWLLAEVLDGPLVYPIAYAIFIGGLAARSFDGTYLSGLRHYLEREPLWGLGYGTAGVVVGLGAWLGMLPLLGPGLAGALALGTAVPLHFVLLRRARKAEPSASRRSRSMLLALTLAPLSILHEAGMFRFIVEATGNLGPLAFAIVPVTAMATYLPVRLHAFADDPGDRSNVAWFWITVGWLALQPIIALGPALAAEL